MHIERKSSSPHSKSVMFYFYFAGQICGPIINDLVAMVPDDALSASSEYPITAHVTRYSGIRNIRLDTSDNVSK